MICFRRQNPEEPRKEPNTTSQVGKGLVCPEPVRPYRYDRDYASTRLFLRLILFFFGVLIAPVAMVQSAAVVFTQGNWNVQNPQSIATTPFTGWQEYSAKDVGVVIGPDIRLEPVNYTLVQTSQDGAADTCIATGCDTGGGFESGVLTNTDISGKGANARVHLATTPVFTDWSTRYVGTGATGGAAHRVAVAGNYAYMTDTTAGLAIMNIAAPAAPTLLSTYALGATAQGIDVSGNYVYVAANELGFKIIYVNDPVNPSTTYTYDTAGEAYGVDFDNNYLYVADGSNGFKIFDVISPSAPTYKGGLLTAGVAKDVFVNGNHAYIAAGSAGLHIVNVIDKDAPSLIATRDTTGDATSVIVKNNFAYIADGDSGLAIFNVTSPSTPTYVGTHDTPGFANGVDVIGNYGYVADTTSGLEIFELGSGALSKRVGSYDTAGVAKDVFVSGNYAYVTDASSGLEIIHIGSPLTSPYLTGGNASAVTGEDVYVDGPYAYVINDTTGLHIFDIRTQSLQNLVGTFPALGEAWDIDVQYPFAFVAGGAAGLKVLDISQPANPTLHTILETLGAAYGLQVVGTTAYIADDTAGLQVMDVSNPLAPTMLGSLDTPGNAQNVDVIGTFVFLADGGSGLLAIDVTEPATPTLTAVFATTGLANDVIVKGDYAFVTELTDGMEVVDINPPASMSLAGSLGTYGSAYKIDLAGNFAYIANGSGGLHIVNISTPSTPKTAAVYDAGNFIKSIDADGNYVYVVDDLTGLQTIRVSDYASSGTFQSPVLNLGAGQDITSIQWLPYSAPPGTTLTMQMQGGSAPTPDCPGACSVWNNWQAVTNDTGAGSALDNYQYLRYKASFTTTDIFVSPKLYELRIQFSNFPIGAGLESSVFDTGSDKNFLKDISWTESLNTHDVRLQVATSPNNVNWNYCGTNACSTSAWLPWDASVNNYYTDFTGDMPHGESSDIVNDRYFKYKLWMSGDGTGTPVVDDIMITFDTAGLKVLAPDGVASSHTPTAGVPFNIVVKVTDSGGAVINNHDVATTIKLKASSAQPDKGGCTSSFADAGNTEFSTAGSIESGVMTIANVVVCDASVSSFTISASETLGGVLTSTANLSVPSVNINFGAMQLAFTTQPPTTTLVSANFAPLPVVSVQDEAGNVDTGEASAVVSLAAYSDSTCTTTPATGLLSVTSNGISAGVTTFSSVQYGTPETIFLKATAGGYASACSTPISVVSAGYVVQIDPIYDAANDAIIVTSSLLRNGTLVADSANMELTTINFLDDEGTILNTSGTTTQEDTGNSLYYTTWNPAGTLQPNISYSIFVEITYDGVIYQGFKSFNVNELGVITSSITNIKNKLDAVQATVTNIDTKTGTLDLKVVNLDAKVTANQAKQATYRASALQRINNVTTNIGKILEDTSTTIPDQLTNTIKAELEKGEFAEIITTQATVRTGTTLPFRFRSASGLTPLVTVTDSAETPKITEAQMREIGGTGLYVYNIAFNENWGLGNFMIKVEEPTKQTRDHLVLEVIPATSVVTAKSVSTSSSALTLDTLYSRLNGINSNMDTLLSSVSTVKENTWGVGTEINGLLESIKKDMETADTSAGDSESADAGVAQKLNKYINTVDAIIGPDGGTSDYRTILGKLNGIEKTLNNMGTDAGAANRFNENAKLKAERVRTFVTLIMEEYKKDGTIEDAEEKSEILEEYLSELKDTVKEIPESLTTDSIATSVTQTLGELDAVTFGNDALKNILPMVQEELEVTQVKAVDDITPVNMLDMRNDVSGLKSLMLEIRGLLDKKVNKPVVHGWLEGNE